jgi:hypothetical protein
MKEKMKPILVHLPPPLILRLNDASDILHLCRAEVIRRSLDEMMNLLQEQVQEANGGEETLC